MTVLLAPGARLPSDQVRNSGDPLVLGLTSRLLQTPPSERTHETNYLNAQVKCSGYLSWIVSEPDALLPVLPTVIAV